MVVEHAQRVCRGQRTRICKKSTCKRWKLFVVLVAVLLLVLFHSVGLRTVINAMPLNAYMGVVGGRDLGLTDLASAGSAWLSRV